MNGWLTYGSVIGQKSGFVVNSSAPKTAISASIKCYCTIFQYEISDIIPLANLRLTKLSFNKLIIIVSDSKALDSTQMSSSLAWKVTETFLHTCLSQQLRWCLSSTRLCLTPYSIAVLDLINWEFLVTRLVVMDQSSGFHNNLILTPFSCSLSYRSIFLEAMHTKQCDIIKSFLTHFMNCRHVCSSLCSKEPTRLHQSIWLSVW